MPAVLKLTGVRQTRLAFASICAAAAALAAIGLLGISGWFLTGAAIAGAGGFAAASAFNYLIPSALIRLLAIVRTLARYGERIGSHKVALEGMADFRGELFDKLAAQDGRSAPDTSPGAASNRLIDDVESLEDLIIRQPARYAALTSAVVGIALAALTGIAPALFLTAAMLALPLIFTRVSVRLTTEPAKDAAQALGALRAAYVELAAARAEIAAYGLADKLASQMVPLAENYDTARGRLVRAEALQGGLLSVYGAVAVTGRAAAGPRASPARRAGDAGRRLGD